MTVALPITLPGEEILPDDRHYTNWQAKRRPVPTIAPAQISDVAEAPEPVRHYTNWTVKPRP